MRHLPSPPHSGFLRVLSGSCILCSVLLGLLLGGFVLWDLCFAPRTYGQGLSVFFVLPLVVFVMPVLLAIPVTVRAWLANAPRPPRPWVRVFLGGVLLCLLALQLSPLLLVLAASLRR